MCISIYENLVEQVFQNPSSFRFIYLVLIDFITSEFETSRNIHHVFAYVMKMSPIASYCREKISYMSPKLPPYLCLCPYFTVYVTLYLLK